MGRRGPPPKPTALRVLQGNPSKRPLPENEPKPPPIAPKCPSWLDKVAKREWRRVAPQLEKLGLLTQVDMAALACYCQAYSDLVAARAAIKQHGMVMTFGETKDEEGNTVKPGYTQARPEVSIANKAMQLIKAFCAEFGCTPSSRGRLNSPKPESEPDAYEEHRRHGQALKGR